MGTELPEDATWEETGAAARKLIRDFLKKIGMPNIAELGIELEAVLKIAPLVTLDTGIAIAPFRITGDRVEKIFKDAYSA